MWPGATWGPGLESRGPHRAQDWWVLTMSGTSHAAISLRSSLCPYRMSHGVRRGLSAGEMPQCIRATVAARGRAPKRQRRSVPEAREQLVPAATEQSEQSVPAAHSQGSSHLG